MSSKRRVRRKSCTGKMQYTAEKEAVGAMIRTPGAGLAVYKCKFCGLYHVGHMNKKQKQGRMAARRSA